MNDLTERFIACGARVYRLLHRQGGVASRDHDIVLRILRDVAVATPELKIRGVAVVLRGARDYWWIDEFIGHVATPQNYGRVSSAGGDTVLRLVGGVLSDSYISPSWVDEVDVQQWRMVPGGGPRRRGPLDRPGNDSRLQARGIAAHL